MPLVVLEGIDGSGKSTQLSLLKDRVEGMGLGVSSLHFPRFNEPVFGELVDAYLKGAFGNLRSMDPRIVALLFAGDQWFAADQIRGWLSEGRVVLLDRYYASNLAYQGAKLPRGEAREELLNWIVRMAIDYFKIPRADCIVYLDMLPSLARSLLDHRNGGVGISTVDIHEQDIDYQREVQWLFGRLGERLSNYHVVSCVDKQGALRSPMAIHDDIVQRVMRYIQPS